MHVNGLALGPVPDSICTKPIFNKRGQTHHIDLNFHSSSQTQLQEAPELNLLVTTSHVGIWSVCPQNVPITLVLVFTLVPCDAVDKGRLLQVYLQQHRLVMIKLMMSPCCCLIERDKSNSSLVLDDYRVQLRLIVNDLTSSTLLPIVPSLIRETESLCHSLLIIHERIFQCWTCPLSIQFE